MIQVNGKEVALSAPETTVLDLLEQFNLDAKAVIVELNMEIVEKMKYSETAVQDGDRVEIVHFVGGG